MPSLYVISAMCGNFWQESTINSAIWQSLSVGNWTDLSKGYGLGQWTNTGGNTRGRLYQLHEYLVNNGYDITSAVGQLNFLIAENVWYSRQEASSFANLQDFLNSDSTDITLLTHAWNIGWEGIHDATWDNRVTYAYNCYNYIQEHYNDPNITEWVYGNRYLSNAERLNNAVMLYRFFNGDNPDQPPEPPDPPQPPVKKKRKMPVWMYCKYTY